VTGRIVAVFPIYGHVAGDDFDGCSSCWDDQWAEGSDKPVPCQSPVPSRLVGGVVIEDVEDALASGRIEMAPCQNCRHAVGLGMYL
jgi:hypothetical protein